MILDYENRVNKKFLLRFFCVSPTCIYIHYPYLLQAKHISTTPHRKEYKNIKETEKIYPSNTQ